MNNISNFFSLLYSELIISLKDIQGEISYYFKLFLHVVYELDSTVRFLKDVFQKEREKVSDILRKEVNRDKRRFEKIYYEFDMNSYFDRLMSWFEERSESI